MKKNVILLFLWIAFFVLVIFHFKFEESDIVFRLSLASAMTPIFSLSLNTGNYTENKWWRDKISILIFSVFILIILGFLSLIYGIIPKDYALSYAIFLWIIEVASLKLKGQGGLIYKISKLKSIVYEEHMRGDRIKVRLSYDFKIILYAFSPFKEVC